MLPEKPVGLLSQLKAHPNGSVRGDRARDGLRKRASDNRTRSPITGYEGSPIAEDNIIS